MTGDVTKVIETRSGSLRCSVEDGLVVGRGIRFGEAPVGDARFAPPVAAPPWSGVRDALAFGPTCPQNPAMLSAPGERQDEDCLFLNVWTPEPEPSARLPVMVWIHGGGFTTGSGSTPWYDGAALARRGVVVVTINYRLGAFGFLHAGALDDAPDRLADCINLGLRDQLLALEWVRDHVESFGGDPDRVTLFGESAGGMSIGTLLGVPAATGLYRRAILQSGASRNVASRGHAAAIAASYLDCLGVDRVEEMIEAPVDALLAAQTAVTERLGGSFLPFGPMVDDDVLPNDPLDVLAAGERADIDIVIGTTTDEAKLFTAFVPKLREADLSEVARRIERASGHDPAEMVEVYRARLSAGPPSEVFDAAFTDWVFRIPAIELAELQVAAGASVWMYEFAERSTSFDGALGACHAIDVPFVWDNIDASGVRMLLGDRTDAHRGLAAEVADSWVRFATSGNPNPAGSDAWPRYDLTDRPTRRFTTEGIDTTLDPRGDERELWPVRRPDPR